MKFDAVCYESSSLSYPLGQELRDDFEDLLWVPIQSYNPIKEVQEKPNAEFGHIKHNLIVGIGKTHKYAEDHRVPDHLVPYISSSCTTVCLYCCLVCNYNECAYLCLLADREQMLDRTLKRARTSEQPLTFKIGSNSGLVLENTITGNLQYTVSRFVLEGAGKLTLPTRSHMVNPILDLDHREKVTSRMSVNPWPVISWIELGISSLAQRIEAVNRMCDHGYFCGFPIVPVILAENWRELYTDLLEELEARLIERMRRQMFLEAILMTYSYVHGAMNDRAFPDTLGLYDSGIMTEHGGGKYCYRGEVRADAELFLRVEINRILGPVPILHIS